MEEHEGSQKFQQAQAFIQAGQYNEALALLDSLRLTSPNEKNILHATALCLEKLARLDEAKEMATRLAAEFPEPKYADLRDRLTQSTAPAPEQAPGTPPPLPPPGTIRPQPAFAPAPSPVKLQSTRHSSNTPLLVGVICVLLVVGLFFIGILAAILIPALSRSREAAQRASCQNNLKHWGLVYKMYANEHENGAYPATWNNDTPFAPNPVVYPEYLTDTNIAVCPSDQEDFPPEWDAETVFPQSSYFYFGYVLTTEEEMLAFLEAYPEFLAKEADFSDDLPAPPGRGSFGSDTFFRLREGIERFGITDINDPRASANIQSQIPIMMDRIAGSPSQGMLTLNHIPGGCNVLYMDGHVEYVKYPRKFPITPAVVEALNEFQ
jgi:prepilin-type processing-associated H-X9-DG protein